MVQSSEPDLASQFQARLLAAIDEVAQHTRIGIRGLRANVEAAGALSWARDQLSPVGLTAVAGPFAYFIATKRIGRMDLSVEAIALEPRWKGLFTREQADRAMDALRDHGFDPGFGVGASVNSDEQAPARLESGFAPIRIDESARFGRRLWDLLHEPKGCEMVAIVAEKLRGHQFPTASAALRAHIAECRDCRARHPEVGEAMREFDGRAVQDLSSLLGSFGTTLLFVDELDSVEPHFREFLAWRAATLGCQVGRFMAALADSFPDQDSLWLKWRQGDLPGEVSDFVRKMDDKQFELALCANNLASVFSTCPCVEDGVLWLPADENLTSVPGVLQVDRCGPEEWREICDRCDYFQSEWPEFLEPPPADINTLALLSMAWQAGVREPHKLERATCDVDEAQGRSVFEELQYGQNAMIAQLEAMVETIKSTNVAACEESLKAKLPRVYMGLVPESLDHLLLCEQLSRLPSIAVPGAMLWAAATAWEIQFENSEETAGLLKFGHTEGSWNSLYKRVDRLLRKPDIDTLKYLGDKGLDSAVILKACREVSRHRNPAAHGSKYGLGSARAILDRWYQWEGKPGGIFSVFFSASQTR